MWFQIFQIQKLPDFKAVRLFLIVSMLAACGGGGGGGGSGNTNPGNPSPEDFTSLSTDGEAVSRPLAAERSAYYRFEGQRDVTYAVSLTSLSGDAAVAAFSGITVDETNVIVFSLNAPDGSGNPEDVLVFTADETQTYYLEVYAGIGSNYQISIAPATEQQIGLEFDRDVIGFTSVSAPTVPINQYVLSPIATTEILTARHTGYELIVTADQSWMSVNVGDTTYDDPMIQTDISLDITSTEFQPGIQTAQVSVIDTNYYDRRVRKNIRIDHLLVEPPFTFSITSPSTVNYGELSTSSIAIQSDLVAQAAVHFGPAGMVVTQGDVLSWTPNGPIFNDNEMFNWSVKVSGTENNILVSLAQDGNYQVLKSTDFQPFVKAGMSFPYFENNLLVGNFNSDPLNEIVVTGGAGTIYAKQVQMLVYDGTGYRAEWIYPFDLAPGHIITALAGEDTNDDNISDIIVATGLSCTSSSSCFNYLPDEMRPRISVIDGDSKQVVAETTDHYDHYGYPVTGDFDNDGSKDIATLVIRNSIDLGDTSELFLNVYDAATLQLSWQSPRVVIDLTYNRATTHLAAGDIDNDGVVELIAAAGYIYGFHPAQQTYQLEWNNNGKFGSFVATGDVNADGVADVVAADGQQLSAFEFQQRTMLFSSTVNPDFSTSFTDARPLVANVDADPQQEIIYGTTILSYDATYFDVVVDQYDSRFSGIRNVVYADSDNDGQQELIFLADALSTAHNILFVTSPDPVTGILNIEWFNNYENNIRPPYVGAVITEPSIDGTKATFAASGSWEINGDYLNESYKQDRSGGLIYIDPVNGTHDTTPPLLGFDLFVSPMVEALDFDGDSRNEIYIANPQIPSGEELIFDPESQSLLQQSLSTDNISLRSAKADFNNDQVEEIIIVDDQGRITIKDVSADSILAQTGDLQAYQISKDWVFIQTHDVITPLDGIPEIFLALGNTLYLFQYNPDTQTLSLQNEYQPENTNFIDGLAVGDIEGDSNVDIILTFGALYQNEPYNMLLLDSQFNEVRRYSLNYDLRSVYFEDLGTSQKNILLVGKTLTTSEQATFLMLIDPASGRSIWQSPFLLGNPDDASLMITDITQDGDYEMLIGTDQVMFVTR